MCFDRATYAHRQMILLCTNIRINERKTSSLLDCFSQRVQVYSQFTANTQNNGLISKFQIIKRRMPAVASIPYTAEGPDGAMATAIIHIGKTIRSCLDFISALVERTFCVGFFSRGAANSGLFARIEREKMPKRISNKPKSISLNISAIKSKTASKTPPSASALPEA